MRARIHRRFSPPPRLDLRSTSSKSARARRESHVGASVPDAVDAGADPALRVERRDALEHGALVLLEKLSPVERAAYVLREAFDYPHRQVARVLGLTEANARQLVTRARMHLSSDRRRRVGAEEHERFVKALACAAQTGNLLELEHFLVADAGRVVRRPTASAPGSGRGLRFGSVP